MTKEESKYVFSLTFKVNLGKYGYSLVEYSIWTNNPELNYSEIQLGKEAVRKSAEADTRVKSDGVFLINSIRTLNDYQDE